MGLGFDQGMSNTFALTTSTHVNEARRQRVKASVLETWPQATQSWLLECGTPGSRLYACIGARQGRT
jgi:hypothetical protein